MQKRVHFIGIGGTGISAIALMLLARGWQVSGSDANASSYFEDVTLAGAKTVIGHDPDLVKQADLVVRSSAISEFDPDVLTAKEAGIPVLKRSEFLPVLTEGKEVLAVAGSHGKTTTTAMLIEALRAAGEDPSFILGAKVKSLGTNAHEGQTKRFVVEADEYDNMFLGLEPTISLITNIEHDHPDFFPTEADYLQAFKAFALKTRGNGTLLLCGDDRLSQKLLTQLEDAPFKVLSFGFGAENDYQIQNSQTTQTGRSFELSFKTRPLGQFKTHLPGQHNVIDAAAAMAMINQAGLNLKKASKGLQNFTGSERRFDIYYQKAGLTLVNDYGHHPTQLKATLEACRETYPQATLWAVWEPHTFSRTQNMQAAFTESLKGADRVIITKIYAAREADNGYTPQAIADQLQAQNALYLPDFDEVADLVTQGQHGNDLVIIFSAGKGLEISHKIVAKFDENLEVKA
jgi:UDP-N-acetylmuramate--alanine ligase